MYPENLSEEKLLNSIMNVNTNIRSYKDAKKMGKPISKIVSLKVLEEQQKKLMAEFNRRHKGELRGDGGIIGKD